MSRSSQSPNRHSKSRSRSVHIFVDVTAKIEPAILKRFTKQELDSRLNQVSQEAGVEVIRDGNGFAFRGKWKDVAYAQAALRSMYVNSISDGIEDKLYDTAPDDDRVSLRTSKCGSICSVSSSHSRAKIYVGNLSERVSMALEKSSSRRSISEKSTKPPARSESDNESIRLKPRNQQDNNSTPKRTSLFSNLVHHKKSYIQKCASLAQTFQNEENDCEPKTNEDQPMVQCEMPRPKQEATPMQCNEAQTHTIQNEVQESVPSLIHYDPVYDSGFRLPDHYPPKVIEATFPEPSPFLYPRGVTYGVNSHRRLPVLPAFHPEPPTDVFSSRLVPPPQPPQHPGFTFESVTHDAFFYQNRAFLPHSLPFFPEPSVQTTPPAGPPKWEVMDQTPATPGPRTGFGYELCDYIPPRNQPPVEKRSHSERISKCHICDASFESTSDLKLHLRSHSTKHRCDDCGKTYKSLRVLKKHQLTHEGSYVKPTFRCGECGKTFSTKYVLQNHVDNIHNGKQPAFVCRVCDKHFTQKHSLTEHQNIHLGLKPFKCETCQKSFSFRTSLSQHILLHGAERHYRCEVCGKSFLQKNSLRLHSAIHSDNRAHCCSYCGKGFTQKQAMLRHERIHNGEKPYSCEICGRAFNDSSILRRHMHVHRKNQAGSATDGAASTSNFYPKVEDICVYPPFAPDHGSRCRPILTDAM